MAQVTGILRPRRRENPAACTGLHSWSRTEGRRRRPAEENGNSMIFALPQVSSRLPQKTSSELQIELQPSDCEAHTRDSLGKATTPLTVPLSGRASADFSLPSRLPGERILELIQVRQAHIEPETKTESGGPTVSQNHWQLRSPTSIEILNLSSSNSIFHANSAEFGLMKEAQSEWVIAMRVLVSPLSRCLRCLPAISTRHHESTVSLRRPLQLIHRPSCSIN